MALQAMVFDDGGAVITEDRRTRLHLDAAEVDALRDALARNPEQLPATLAVPWDVNTPLIVVGPVSDVQIFATASQLYPGTAVRVCMHRRSLKHGREYMVADSVGGRAWVPEASLSPVLDFAPEPEPLIPADMWDAATVKVGDRFKLLSSPGFSAEHGWRVGDVVEVVEDEGWGLEVKNLSDRVEPGWATHNTGFQRLGERVS